MHIFGWIVIILVSLFLLYVGLIFLLIMIVGISEAVISFSSKTATATISEILGIEEVPTFSRYKRHRTCRRYKVDYLGVLGEEVILSSLNHNIGDTIDLKYKQDKDGSLRLLKTDSVNRGIISLVTIVILIPATCFLLILR